MEPLILLHIGCGGLYYQDFINCDKSNVSPRGKSYPVDKIFDLGNPWPFADQTIDGIVGMHVLQQLYWRDLVVCLREAYRVLKKDGVLRFGCPMVEIEDRPLEYLLGWRNINLFSFDLLNRVFKRIGFSHFRERGYRRSRMPELAKIDNRPHRGTLYYEVIK